MTTTSLTDKTGFTRSKEEPDRLLHRIECHQGDLPEKFPDPFRYVPCPAVIRAADEVMRHIRKDRSLDAIMAEGKMLGVLIVRPGHPSHRDDGIYYLAAFSGNAGGRNIVPYFVPPVFDLLAPDGHFRKEEEKISEINARLSALLENPGYVSAGKRLDGLRQEMQDAMDTWKARMAASRQRRERIRTCLLSGITPDSKDLEYYQYGSGHGPGASYCTAGNETADTHESLLQALIKESQFEKAEKKRLHERFSRAIGKAGEEYNDYTGMARQLASERRRLSDSLQKWISDSFIVYNALGQSKSITEIFSARGLVPPGGTGECAAPKLLQYAYIHGLKPVAMGEFWYGKSPDKEIRCHGKFYPSCSSKCGPLLGFMLQGLDLLSCSVPYADRKTSSPPYRILMEDDHIIVAEKPSGMLSVPGKTGTQSLLEILRQSGRTVLAVHRLDMDTSGLMVFAKTGNAQKALQRQFESRQVIKTYSALIDTSVANGRHHKAGEKGIISLPLLPDIDDRPRQKADRENGKEAVTEYKIISCCSRYAEVRFRPLTGKTHQLRVHAAHPDGLGAPIMGDRLYGSAASAQRLCLHACTLEFIHPANGKPMKFSSEPDFMVNQ